MYGPVPRIPLLCLPAFTARVRLLLAGDRFVAPLLAMAL